MSDGKQYKQCKDKVSEIKYRRKEKVSPSTKQQNSQPTDRTMNESSVDDKTSLFYNNDFVASNVDNVVTHYNEHERQWRDFFSNKSKMYQQRA